MANIPVTTITLQDNVGVNEAGTTLNIISGMETANVEIASTSTDAVVNFEAQVSTTDWYAVNGVNLSNFSVATSPLAVDSIHQIDLTGFSALRCRVSDITSGNVTVTARVVR